MTVNVNANKPQEVISPAISHLARLQTIIQIHDETVGAISEMETYDDLGMAENTDPRFVGEIEQRRKVLTQLVFSLKNTMNMDINKVRSFLVQINGALNNHKELLVKIAEIEGAFNILVEANEFAEDGEGSREHYEALLSSLRNQLSSSTLYLVRLLRESGMQISSLVGADDNNG